MIIEILFVLFSTGFVLFCFAVNSKINELVEGNSALRNELQEMRRAHAVSGDYISRAFNNAREAVEGLNMKIEDFRRTRTGCQFPQPHRWRLQMLSPASWQPLETAPKDGSSFLVYNSADGSYDVVEWDRHSNGFTHCVSHERVTDGWWMRLPEVQGKTITMRKYRRKPEVVEAVRVLAEPSERNAEILSWLGGDAFISGFSIYFNGVPWHTARPGDWVLKNEKGEFSSLSHAQFMERYELL